MDCEWLVVEKAFRCLPIDDDIYYEAPLETTVDIKIERREDKLEKVLREPQVEKIKAVKQLSNFPTSNDFEADTKETSSSWSGDT